MRKAAPPTRRSGRKDNEGTKGSHHHRGKGKTTTTLTGCCPPSLRVGGAASLLLGARRVFPYFWVVLPFSFWVVLLSPPNLIDKQVSPSSLRKRLSSEKIRSASATQWRSFGCSTDKRKFFRWGCGSLRKERGEVAGGHLRSSRKLVARAGMKQTVRRGSAEAIFARASSLQWTGAASRSTSQRQRNRLDVPFREVDGSCCGRPTSEALKNIVSGDLSVGQHLFRLPTQD